MRLNDFSSSFNNPLQKGKSLNTGNQGQRQFTNYTSFAQTYNKLESKKSQPDTKILLKKQKSDNQRDNFLDAWDRTEQINLNCTKNSNIVNNTFQNSQKTYNIDQTIGLQKSQSLKQDYYSSYNQKDDVKCLIQEIRNKNKEEYEKNKILINRDAAQMNQKIQQQMSQHCETSNINDVKEQFRYNLNICERKQSQDNKKTKTILGKHIATIGKN